MKDERKKKSVGDAKSAAKTRKPTVPKNGKVVQRTKGRSEIDKNAYLATLLDPAGVTGVGIPDACMLKTAKFHCKHTIDVTTDAYGNAAYHFRPSISQSLEQVGGIQLGSDAGGRVHYMESSSGTDLGTATPCVGFGVVSANDYAEVISGFSAYRPVSFSATWESTRPVLSAKGTVTGGLVAREAVIFAGEPAATVGNGLVWHFQQGRGLGNVAAARDIPRSVTIPSLDPMTVIWAPEDEIDRRFFPTKTGIQGDTTTEPGFMLSSIQNPTTTFNDQYYAPFNGFIQQEDTSGVIDQAFDFPNVPTLHMSFSGCETGTVIGTITFETNFEAIQQTETLFVESAATPENPLELAQADNVMRLIDKVETPREPQSLGNLSLAAAESATTHLYDGKTSLKAAIEGESIKPIFKSLAKGAASVAAPALMGVPVVGPALSMGASLLASIL